MPVLSSASQSVIAENYLKQDRPFIVTDAMADWDAMTTLNLNFIYQVAIIVADQSCMFCCSCIRLRSDYVSSSRACSAVAVRD